MCRVCDIVCVSNFSCLVYARLFIFSLFLMKRYENKYDFVYIFVYLDSLEWLNLAGNQLDSIPSEALRRLVRLRQLDLRGNLISAVHEDDFQSFGKTLKFIHLQKNQWVKITTFAFANIAQPQKYDTFRQNKISQ